MPLIQGTGVADVDVEGPETAEDAEVVEAAEVAEDEEETIRMLSTESMLAIQRVTLQPKNGKRLVVPIEHLLWKCVIVRRAETLEAEDAVEAKVEDTMTIMLHLLMSAL
jgi:hypothetical protein